MTRTKLVQLGKDTFSNWLDDKGPKMAAALAYYTIFSLAPLLIIAIAVASLFLSGDAARGEVARGLSGLVGPTGAQAIQTMLVDTVQSYGLKGGVIATIIGVIVLLWGAIGVFIELQDSLNTIWKVDKRKTSGVRAYLQQTLLSFSMILGVGFLLIVSLLVSTCVEGVVNHLGDIFGNTIGDISERAVWFWELVNFGISFCITALMFASIFKILPNAKIAWRDVWIGGTLTAALFVLGKTVLAVYLGRSGLTSAFGAAGSVVLLLVWVYYTAQIFFLCAEFTYAYGLTLKPAGTAVTAGQHPTATKKMGEDKRTAATKEASTTANLKPRKS